MRAGHESVARETLRWSACDVRQSELALAPPWRLAEARRSSVVGCFNQPTNQYCTVHTLRKSNAPLRSAPPCLTGYVMYGTRGSLWQKGERMSRGPPFATGTDIYQVRLGLVGTRRRTRRPSVAVASVATCIPRLSRLVSTHRWSTSGLQAAARGIPPQSEGWHWHWHSGTAGLFVKVCSWCAAVRWALTQPATCAPLPPLLVLTRLEGRTPPAAGSWRGLHRRGEGVIARPPTCLPSPPPTSLDASDFGVSYGTMCGRKQALSTPFQSAGCSARHKHAVHAVQATHNKIKTTTKTTTKQKYFRRNNDEARSRAALGLVCTTAHAQSRLCLHVRKWQVRALCR